LLLLLLLLLTPVPCVSQVWTMVAIYLAVACVAVIFVVVFVDDPPSDLVDKRTDVGSEV